MLNRVILFAAVAALLCCTAQAATYDWDYLTPMSSSTWSAASSWQGGVVPAFVAGDTANIWYCNHCASIGAIGHDAPWELNPDVHTFGVQLNSTVTLGTIVAGHNAGVVGDCGLNQHWTHENFLSHLYGTGLIIWDNNGSGALFDQSEMWFRDPYTATWSVAMQLDDDLTMQISAERPRVFSSTISGPGKLTIDLNFVQDRQLALGAVGNAANTYAGGTVLNYTGTANPNRKFIARKTGTFGTGDVTLNDKAILQLDNQPNIIDDTASLIMVTGSSLVLNNTGTTETVAGISLDGGGSWLPPATYTNAETWITGSGTITVVSSAMEWDGGPGDWSINNWSGGQAPEIGLAMIINADTNDSDVTYSGTPAGAAASI